MKTINQLQAEITELQDNKLIVGKTYDANVLKEIDSKKTQVLELYKKELESLQKPTKSLYRVTE